ncbi:MAG: diguanylate cyclase [Pseudomonadota bacterium]
MLYQGLLLITLFATAILLSRSGQAASGQRAYRALCLCAASVVASACLIPVFSQVGTALVIPTAAGGVLASALLLPILFLNIKQYTNLALPQWAALRAFCLGIPALLGLNEAAAILNQSQPTTALPASVLVSWTFALLCLVASTWRFVSTPRGRRVLAGIMAGTVALVLADALARIGDQRWLGLPPQAWIIAGTIAALVFRGAGEGVGSVRPVSRSIVVDQVQDALLVLDNDNRILDYNRVAAAYLCADGSELVGANAALHLPPELIAHITADPGSDAEPGTTLNWASAGEPRWLDIQVRPLLVDGKHDGQLLTLRDVTRRHLAELALQDSQAALQEANAKLEALANTDALTGLYNRRFFMEQLSLEMERHSRSGLTLGLLMLDLDHFKSINDTHGHPMGDRVLQEAARTLQQGIRDADVVARIGGEEFAVLVVDATMDGPRILAERLCTALRALELRTEDGTPVPVSTSVGCLRFRGGMVDADTLLALTDQALYAAKEGGRDRVEVASYRPLPRTRRFGGKHSGPVPSTPPATLTHS